jgi:hypothetical protein
MVHAGMLLPGLPQRHWYRRVRRVAVLALCLLGAASAASAQSHVVSDYKGTYYGPYPVSTFPAPPETVDTFSYRVLPGETVLAATVSGNWGIPGYFEASTAGADIYVDGVRVAQCISGQSCWANGGPEPWSYTFGSGDYSRLTDGSAVMTAVQTSQTQMAFSDLRIEITLSCVWILSSSSATVPAAGGSFSFGVTTGCSWKPSSNVAWIVPSGSGGSDGTVNYTVSANAGTASRSGTITVGNQTFTVTQLAAPTVTSISPTSGTTAGGTPVTIGGTNFIAGNTTVTIGGTAATSVNVTTPSTLTAVTPAHAAGAVNVVVTTPGGAGTLTNGFTYVAPPGAFSRTSPANSATNIGTSPALTWSVSSGATSYQYCYDTINNNACDATWTSVGTNTSVTLGPLTPDATYYWHVRAQNVGGTTYADGIIDAFWRFNVPPPPGAFNKSSPSSGATGQSANPTLSWGASTAATSYEYCIDTLNNNVCDASWTSNGTSTSKALSGLSPGTPYYWHVRASNAVGTTYANGSATAFWGFVVQALPPAFNKSLPSSGATAQSTSPTLSWGTSSGAISYEYCIDTINNNACDTSWTGNGTSTSKALSGLSPGTPYYWHVRANNAGGTTYANSSTTAFWSFTTASTPAVKSVSPNAGPLPGSTYVTMTGSGFTSNTTVTLGGAAADVRFVAIDGTVLEAWTPAHAKGPVDVVVTTPGGVATLTNGFTYLGVPVVASVTPNAGPPAGGTPVTITGTDFFAGASVFFGGEIPATTVVVVNATTITAVSPPGALGAVDVMVETRGGSGVLTSAFTYREAVPAITSVVPTSGPLAGGTALAITGSGFTPAAVVTVGGFPATGITFVNATRITAVTPAATVAGARDVVVTTSGGTATRVGAFTYVADVVTDETRSDTGEPVPPGTDFLQPALSGDGRYVAYVVTSDALITGDTNRVPDVVVRDRVTGQVVRVSVGSDGAQANGASGRPRISASGRYVAFWSEASTLVAGDTNGVRDVFLHDRDADGNGVFDETAVGARTTTRVSVATSGAQGDAASALDGEPLVAGVASDGQLDLSPDGLWVAFRSAASTLVAGDTNGVADIFLRSVAGQQTTRVSVTQGGTQADGASQSPGVSAGAQRLVFASRATNLVAGDDDANGVLDVFVVERSSGQVVRLSEPAPGIDANGASDLPAIDDAGRTVVFATLARNIVPALTTSTTSQIVVVTLPPSSGATVEAPAEPGVVAAGVIDVSGMLKQLASGAVPPGTATVEPGNGASTQPEVCGNGSCVGYVSAATNLTPTEAPDTNDAQDAFIQPVVLPPPTAPPPPTRLSRDTRGNQATEATTHVAVGGDGAVVALESEAALTPEVAAANPDGVNVFVRAVPLVLATVSRTSARIDVSETVVFTGAGFQTGATVLFGTMGMTGTVSDEGRTLTAATPTTTTQPTLAPGVVALTVRNPDGSTVPVFQGFTFLAPPGPTPTTDADADGLPDDWETRVGLSPTSASGAEGASGDPDSDGLTNAQEYAQQTHPRASFTRYLAEGATSTFFTTTLGLANASATQTAHTWLRFQKSDGTQVPWDVAIPPLQSRTVVVNTIAGLATAEFSTVVESDEPVAVHRMLTWDAVRGYGSHLEAAVLAPAPRWYLAEGSTNAGFQLFYLIQNPGTTAAEVEVKFLLPSGAPVVKTYSVAAGSRFNVWVNTLPELASTDCSAVITATNGVPIIVERAMYLDGPGLPFGAGHESAGVTAPAERWFLAEGATGPYFDLFVLVANPNDAAAELEATYLLPDGSTVVKPYTVAPNSRFNIWVDYEDTQLANTAVSTLIRSTNGVPVLVERAMWWPQVPGWWEAHDAFGATQPGTLWALGSGELTGPPTSAATYVLIANTSVWEAAVRVSVLFEDGTAAVTRTFAVNATSRFNVDVGAEFPEVAGRRFGVVVESVPTATAGAAQIVVEGARYHNDTAGVVWAAGADALATRLR